MLHIFLVRTVASLRQAAVGLPGMKKIANDGSHESETYGFELPKQS